MTQSRRMAMQRWIALGFAVLLAAPQRDRILQYYPHGGSILDIACGVGGFLAKFDDRWTLYGVEPSDFAEDKAQKKGIHLFHELRTVEMETMDVVVFRGTLQHINFPMAALAHAHRILKPGGLLVILATPDTDVWCTGFGATCPRWMRRETGSCSVAGSWSISCAVSGIRTSVSFIPTAARHTPGRCQTFVVLCEFIFRLA